MFDFPSPLANTDVQIHIMPIIELRGAGREGWLLRGFEGLARGPAGTPLEAPYHLFAAAREAGCSDELELHCLATGLELAQRLPSGLRIFLNLSPHLLIDPRLHGLLSGHRGVAAVLEITEGPLPTSGDTRSSVEEIAAQGYEIAIDDVGARGSGVRRMLALDHADFYKVDRNYFTQLYASDPGAAESWLGRIKEQARARGGELVVEGVEEDLHVRHLLSVGGLLAQGWRFGRAEAFPGTWLPKQD